MKIISLLLLLQVVVISQYLSYKEATRSAYADSLNIVNAPSPAQLKLIKQFGVEYFDPLRKSVGDPLHVSSLFRNKEINERVGGAKHSDHLILNDVVACDIDQDGKGGKIIGNRPLFFHMKDSTTFRKLIWEFGTESRPAWVHVSWSSTPEKNIGKVYRATKVNNRTIYTTFDPYE